MSRWGHCCWPGCHSIDLDASDDLPLCGVHYHHVGIRFMAGRTILSPEFDRDQREAEHVQRSALARRQAAARLRLSQVYYLRIGDHVKIGFTANLRQRLNALRLDDDAVLAAEPGGRGLEAQRHHEFAAERVGRRENFNPSPRLLAHIDDVRRAHGSPRIRQSNGGPA